MKVKVYESSEKLGVAAAKHAADVLNAAIADHGSARLILSTGASQFDTLKPLTEQKVDWSKVEMFHLDEYIGIPETHKASFRKYLKEKFTTLLPLKAAHFVVGEGDVEKNIAELSKELCSAPIDLALIGIGENSHIAFNDPPADFDTKESYIIVNLDEACKNQQVREGWFPTIDDVPKQAITMTPYRMMQSRVIISSVPYEVKANAIKLTLENEVTNKIPATLLKTHADWALYIDKDSASKTDPAVLKKVTE